MIDEDTHIPHHITLNIVNEHETVLFPDVEALAYATLSSNPVKPSVSSNPLTPTCYKKPKDNSGNNPPIQSLNRMVIKIHQNLALEIALNHLVVHVNHLNPLAEVGKWKKPNNHKDLPVVSTLKNALMQWLFLPLVILLANETDNRSDEQILSDIVRTCSLNVTKG